MGEGLIASGRRISSRVRICEPVTMMIMIMVMTIMMKTNPINDGDNDAVREVVMMMKMLEMIKLLMRVTTIMFMFMTIMMMTSMMIK